MEEKEMIIRSPRGDIFSVYNRGSAGSGSRPLVIMCHGLMMDGSLNPIRDVAAALSEYGYDTLRIDFRGSGRSSGKITAMTPLTEVEDLLSVMSSVNAGETEIPGHRRAIVCGHSLGGLVSLLAASYIYGADLSVVGMADGCREALKKSLAGLVLMAPAVNIEEDSRAGRVAYETFDPVDIPEEVEVWGSRLSRNYFLTARNMDTFNTIAHYEGPACVLLGERDRIVEMNLSERIASALPQAEIHVIPHGDHLFSRMSRIRAVQIAEEFLSSLH